MRWIVLTIALAASAAYGQTTRPDPTATTVPTADQLLNQMMRPAESDKTAVIAPQTPSSSASLPQRPSPTSSTPSTPSSPAARAAGNVVASAASVGILREGTDVVDRVGRLQKAADGLQQEFVFESDGRTLQDPPVGILPNLKLMQMEGAVATASHDLRFRVTGSVTEYRGKNYILLEKVVVVQDKDQEF